MILQTTGSDGLLYKIIERAIIESHQNEKFKFNVVNSKNVSEAFREAVKERYDVKEMIDDVDVLVCFQELEAAGQEQPSTQDQAQEPAADDGNAEETTAEPEQDDSSTEQDTGDEEASGTEDEEEVDEQLELENAVRRALMEDDDEEGDGNEDQPQEQPQEEPQGDDVKDATPAEDKEAKELGVTANESSSRESLIKAVARALYIEDAEKLETFDVDLSGTKTFIMKFNIRK